MKCTNTIEQLEDYLDDTLSPAEAAGMRRHLEECPACAAELRDLSGLRRELGRLPAPAAGPEFLERLLARAVRTPKPAASVSYRRQDVWQRVGVATAAVLLLAVGFGLGLKIAVDKPFDAGPQIVLAAQPIQLGPTGERVGLMFRTTSALHDASISVSLPDDVQIAGRPNVRHLSWHTDLKPGPNLLELPLQATGSHGGTLVVRLAQGSVVKTLEIPIAVRPLKSPATGLRSGAETQALT
jgi:hypothetical protein